MRNGNRFAGYTIERELGRGGMGTVYLARHPRLPRLDALKLLNGDLRSDPEAQRRFEREADVVARLDHRNIVAVHDRGIEDGQSWIAMQYIDGTDAVSLDPRLLPPAHALYIIGEVSTALDYAHSMGVLHRDIKPANILLARSRGNDHRVYLTDFGIARMNADSTRLTQTGTFTATLAYASPEQLSGQQLDHRSDQYSLACTLYWLLTGQSVFAARDPAAVIAGHLSHSVRPASTLRQGLPPALDAVMNRALAKQPDFRFGSCGEFASAAAETLLREPGASYAARPALRQPAQHHSPANTRAAVPAPSREQVPPRIQHLAPALPDIAAKKTRRRWRWPAAVFCAAAVLISALVVSQLDFGPSGIENAPEAGQCISDIASPTNAHIVECGSRQAANFVTSASTNRRCEEGETNAWAEEPGSRPYYLCTSPVLKDATCYLPKAGYSFFIYSGTCGPQHVVVVGSTPTAQVAANFCTGQLSYLTVKSAATDLTYCVNDL